MTRPCYYFAYGSNLHPVRLTERITSAELIGVARLPGYRLVFHKKGKDGSGKGDIVKTDAVSDLVYGAIYKIDPQHKAILDKIEGEGYTDRKITLVCNGYRYSCYTYTARPQHINSDLKPFNWYVQLIVLGARFLNFPADYITEIAHVDTTDDRDGDRKQNNFDLIERMGGRS